LRSPLTPYGRQTSFGVLHREDSDASSIASDRSFRHEDVPEILANLASVHWSDRKDGLAGLLCLLRNQSHALSDPDLQKVTQTLTKMFMDPHTKVFSLFLDTLNELITVHSGDLHRIGFLSVLLTKLFIKSGQDLLGSVVVKIGRTMDLIRASFPRHDQFTVITRFLNDPAHSSSSAKVKLSVLSYLEALTSLMDSTELPAHDPNLRDTLLKITAWAGDSRHPELQQRARQVIVSLYRVKTPYFSTVITQMAPDFQRTALDVIQNQLKMAGQHGGALNNLATSPKPYIGLDGAGSVPLSPLSGPRSRLGSVHQSSSPQRSFEDENTENFRANPATQLKLMQSLYREQHHQSSGAGGSSGAKSVDDDTDSYKTRLSQGSSSSPKAATPQQSLELENASVASGISVGSAAAKSSASERLAHCVQLLSSPMNSAEQKRSALAELHILVKEPSLWESETQFRAVWRALLVNLADEGGREGVRAPALRGLAELIRRRPQHAQSVQMAQSALEAIVRVNNDKDKDVVRLADDAVTALVTSIDASSMAKACAALSEVLNASTAQPQLAVLGPELIRAYNHPESSVRKAAVFALVGLHQRVGADAMHPYVSHLPGCKLRLLNLYIERASQQTNGQARGESSPSPSNCSNASNL
ncbi:CLIP-associating protein 1-like, partial [Tropilaelaps mercedesae]